MSVNKEQYQKIIAELKEKQVTLVAVSKIKTVADIRELYELGQKDFGENYVQELVEKQAALPADIRWHFIGHLQSNKVKYIAPFVHLVQGVDSFKLLKEINKQAVKNNRIINVLLQVHIAEEETKFGLDAEELEALLAGDELATLQHIRIQGLMGMASFSEDETQVKKEFESLKNLFDRYRGQEKANVQLEILSMGMSGDYAMAIDAGSNMVRIGSLLFGRRG